jgi:hypothetical protein
MPPGMSASRSVLEFPGNMEIFRIYTMILSETALCFGVDNRSCRAHGKIILFAMPLGIAVEFESGKERP